MGDNMKVKKQVTVGVSWTFWDDATIEIDAYTLHSGRRSFSIAHVEAVELDGAELQQLEDLVADQIHMHNKRCRQGRQELLF